MHSSTPLIRKSVIATLSVAMIASLSNRSRSGESMNYPQRWAWVLVSGFDKPCCLTETRRRRRSKSVSTLWSNEWQTWKPLWAKESDMQVKQQILKAAVLTALLGVAGLANAAVPAGSLPGSFIAGCAIIGKGVFYMKKHMKKRIVISLAGALCAISSISPAASALSMNGPFGPNWKGPAQWALAPNVDTYDMPKPFYVPQSEIPVPHGAGPSTGAFFAEAIMGAQPQSTLPPALQQMFQNLTVCAPYVQQAVNNASAISNWQGQGLPPLSGYAFAEGTRDYYGLYGAEISANDYSGGNATSDSQLALFWLEGLGGTGYGPVGTPTSVLQSAVNSLVTAQNALAAGQSPSQVFSGFTVFYGHGSGDVKLMMYLPNSVGDAEAFLKNASADLIALINQINSGGVANVPQMCMPAVQSGYQAAYSNGANQYWANNPQQPPMVALTQVGTTSPTGGWLFAAITPWGNNIGVLGNTLFYSQVGAGGANMSATLGTNGCGTVGGLTICMSGSGSKTSATVQNGAYSTKYGANGTVVASGPSGTAPLVSEAIANFSNATSTSSPGAFVGTGQVTVNPPAGGSKPQ